MKEGRLPADPRGLLNGVGDDQPGGSLPKRVDPLIDRRGDHGVERGAGPIHQQHLGVCRRGARKAQPLLPSARQPGPGRVRALPRLVPERGAATARPSRRVRPLSWPCRGSLGGRGDCGNGRGHQRRGGRFQCHASFPDLPNRSPARCSLFNFYAHAAMLLRHLRNGFMTRSASRSVMRLAVEPRRGAGGHPAGPQGPASGQPPATPGVALISSDWSRSGRRPR